MELKWSMTKIMGTFHTPSPLNSPRRARTFPEDFPVCTKSSSGEILCYDPSSFKRAFHPLGTFSKIFGLFPCYDFGFVSTLTPKSTRIVHILDYIYSAFIFFLLTGGAILCSIYKPGIIQSASVSDRNMDYYVKIALIYATIFCGIQSLFIFPMKWSGMLNFVKLISNIDKILRFDGRMEEKGFAHKVLVYLTGCLVFTLCSFLFLFVYEGQTYKKKNGLFDQKPCITDFLMAPIMTLAIMALVIPTGLAIFFLNAMRLRMEHFNRRMQNLLKPFIPSSCPCVGFSDYGKELDEHWTRYQQQKSNQKNAEKQKEVESNLAEDLEKMRILHCEIRTLANCLSCIFGLHLVRDFLYSLVALVLYTYFLIHFRDEGQYIWVIYAGQAVFIILKMVVMVCFAQLICCQAMVLEGTLQRVSLRRLPEDCGIQVIHIKNYFYEKYSIRNTSFFGLE